MEMPVLPVLPEADLRQGHNRRDFLVKVGVTLERKRGGVQGREAVKATTALLHLLQLSTVGKLRTTQSIALELASREVRKLGYCTTTSECQDGSSSKRIWSTLPH